MWFACTDLLPENCVEEKTKSIDPNAVMAEIKHRNRQGVQLKYCGTNCFKSTKMQQITLAHCFCVFSPVLQIFPCVPLRARQVSGGCQVSKSKLPLFCIRSWETPIPFMYVFLPRNGIYPLMNFASSWPHPIPRALSLSQEQVEMVKTPTPEPQETETRKVRSKDWLWLH